MEIVQRHDMNDSHNNNSDNNNYNNDNDDAIHGNIDREHSIDVMGNKSDNGIANSYRDSLINVFLSRHSPEPFNGTYLRDSSHQLKSINRYQNGYNSFDKHHHFIHLLFREIVLCLSTDNEIDDYNSPNNNSSNNLHQYGDVKKSFELFTFLRIWPAMKSNLFSKDILLDNNNNNNRNISTMKISVDVDIEKNERNVHNSTFDDRIDNIYLLDPDVLDSEKLKIIDQYCNISNDKMNRSMLCTICYPPNHSIDSNLNGQELEYVPVLSNECSHSACNNPVNNILFSLVDLLYKYDTTDFRTIHVRVHSLDSRQFVFTKRRTHKKKTDNIIMIYTDINFNISFLCVIVYIILQDICITLVTHLNAATKYGYYSPPMTGDDSGASDGYGFRYEYNFYLVCYLMMFILWP